MNKPDTNCNDRRIRHTHNSNLQENYKNFFANDTDQQISLYKSTKHYKNNSKSNIFTT